MTSVAWIDGMAIASDRIEVNGGLSVSNLHRPLALGGQQGQRRPERQLCDRAIGARLLLGALFFARSINHRESCPGHPL